MKLGVHIGYWGLGLTSEDQLNIVQEAERLGYDSVWAAEAYGSDTATVLGWLAGQTRRSGSARESSRCPAARAAMTAMTAATIDQLSNGRMILGIGSSGPQVAEGWHGQRFAKQLQRTREYVAVVRMALARERVRVRTARRSSCRCPTVPARRSSSRSAPCRSRSRSTSPRSARRTPRSPGEIADGWIPTLFSPEHVSELRPLLEEGAARSGKSLDELRHRADRAGVRHRRSAGRARRDAAVHRPVRRRHGLAQAELLQPARPALRLRGRGRRDPGPLPRRQARGGDGGDPGRVDRLRLALRAAGCRARAPRDLPRRRRRHARRHADRLHRAPSASSSCG